METLERAERWPQERIVNRVLELRAQGVPQAKVAHTLNSEGFLTRRGKRWSGSSVAHIETEAKARKQCAASTPDDARAEWPPPSDVQREMVEMHAAGHSEKRIAESLTSRGFRHNNGGPVLGRHVSTVLSAWRRAAEQEKYEARREELAKRKRQGEEDEARRKELAEKSGLDEIFRMLDEYSKALAHVPVEAWSERHWGGELNGQIRDRIYALSVKAYEAREVKKVVKSSVIPFRAIQDFVKERQIRMEKYDFRRARVGQN